jgi:hypothetical protein
VATRQVSPGGKPGLPRLEYVRLRLASEGTGYLLHAPEQVLALGEVVGHFGVHGQGPFDLDRVNDE